MHLSYMLDLPSSCSRPLLCRRCHHHCYAYSRDSTALSSSSSLQESLSMAVALSMLYRSCRRPRRQSWVGLVYDILPAILPPKGNLGQRSLDRLCIPSRQTFLTSRQTFLPSRQNFACRVDKLCLSSRQTLPVESTNFACPVDKLCLSSRQTFVSQSTNFCLRVDKLSVSSRQTLLPVYA